MRAPKAQEISRGSGGMSPENLLGLVILRISLGLVFRIRVSV